MKDFKSMTDKEIREYQTELKNKARDLRERIETRKKYLKETNEPNVSMTIDKKLKDLKKELKNTQVEAILLKEYQKPLNSVCVSPDEPPVSDTGDNRQKVFFVEETAAAPRKNEPGREQEPEIGGLKMRTFNVSYFDPENQEDETQFDIQDADFVTMFNELIELFSSFCKENYDDNPCWIIQIEEVPYDQGS